MAAVEHRRSDHADWRQAFENDAKAHPISPEQAELTRMQRTVELMFAAVKRAQAELGEAWEAVERIGWRRATLGGSWQRAASQFEVMEAENTDLISKVDELETELHDERQAHRATCAELERLRALDDAMPHPRRQRRLEQR